MLSESTNMTVTNADIMVIDGQGWSWTVEDKCLSTFDIDTTFNTTNFNRSSTSGKLHQSHGKCLCSQA